MAIGVSIHRWDGVTVRRATATARRVVDAGMRLLRRVAAATRRVPGVHRQPPARELFRSGRTLERAGRHVAATEAYRAAIARDPARPHWHYRLGRTLERTDHWAEAAAAYGQAIAHDPARPRWHYRLGRTLERTRAWADAAAAYEQAIAHDDSRAAWHYRHGRVLERTRHWADAVAAYRAAIQRDPTRPHWHYRLGRTLERIRAWADAAAAYEQAIALDDRPAWRQRHAAALRRAHDHAGLRGAVDAMLAREPDMPECERTLLSADPRRFDVRRQIMRFVTEHLDEIRDVAATPFGVSPHPADRIWVYWAQGIDHAPTVVRRCHDELRRLHPDQQVVVLDHSTVDDHSDLPGYVHDRTRDDRTKYSDVLRLDLLARHGGIWLDATCLPRRDLPGLLPELVPSGFFALRFRRARMASWLLAATPGDPSMATLRAAQLVYWRHHDGPIDYFVLHHLFEALFHIDPDVHAAVEAMPPVSAHTSSKFARAMLEPYDPQRFRRLLDGAFVHKLSHKIPPGRDLRGTMLEHLLEHGGPATTL